VDQDWVAAGENGAELSAVRFGAEDLEDFIEQGLSFPRPPILSLLYSCCSRAADDGYLNMRTSRNAAVLLLFSSHIGAAARP